MPCNYLYIDDEEEELIQPYINSLEKNGDLRITPIKPKEFSKLIKEIMESSANGILIDWKLDERQQENVLYKAGEVAQSIRIKSVEDENLAKPIILISTDDKLKETYSKERTSHDLFDFLYKKNEVIAEGERIAKELIDFANSYTKLKEYRKNKSEINDILKLNEKDLLDSRIYSNFPTKGDNLKPVHEYAQFIINHLIRIPGPLIDEKTMAARLGINITESKNWEVLKEEHLNNFKYTGPFSEIWNRWWSIKLEEWWDNNNGSDKPLQMLKASVRVEHIKNKTGVEITFGKPIEENYSSEYWTICQALQQPLDPVDGFMVESKKQFPWQEELYVSKKSVAERTYKTQGFTIHPLEAERYFEFIGDEEKKRDKK